MKISLLFSIAALFMVANLASNYKDDELHIQWKNNMLAISGDRVYGKEIEILYIEAFCRTGSTNRKWEETTIPHTTELISDSTDQKNIQLKTIVHPSVEVIHNITAGKDEVAFQLTFKNNGSEAVDIDWFQPCIRVDRFTGRNQDNYISRSFIFTSQGMTTLDKTNRTEDAFSRFEVLERRADFAEGRAEALGMTGPKTLEEEIAELKSSDKVDAELEAMKAALAAKGNK